MAALCLPLGTASAVDRTIDGSGNHPTLTMQGAANTEVTRISYQPAYLNGFGQMITTDAQRRNPRTLSNTLMAQSVAAPSARGLSNYVWAWGQFLDHDMDLSTTSDGAGVNGSAPISTGAGDPLGPGPIAFTRSNFVYDAGVRQQINEVTSYIDGSQIYGSDATRAAALRTNGGAGAKLITSANNLLPYNTGGLANQNNGPTPASQLFLAGDIRANENLLLTSMQTVFMREHNRLVDLIATQQPGLGAEQQYQLARKLVGAEIQAITYKEFLPALMGSAAPTVTGYHYAVSIDASVTNSFAHSAFRFGHSTLTSNVNLVDSAGVTTGTMSLGAISSNPNALTSNPGLLNQLLRGAAGQVSEEVDLKMVDGIRNVMFGPPGAGGTDLAAVDIQRGRDHGLPDYNTLRESYGLARITSFNQITTNATVRQQLSTLYNGDVDNIDGFVGGLAEDHVAGSSLGPLFQAIIKGQFERSRDGDSLFYRSASAGLYTGNTLNASIVSLVNLNTVTLSSIIQANTGISGLSSNVFFTSIPGDFNHDGYVNNADLTTWRSAFAAGTMGGADLMLWQKNLGSVAPWVAAAGPNFTSAPEPGTLGLAAIFAAALGSRRRRRAL